MSKAKRVFSAHKEITRSDAKKLRPLTRYWLLRLIKARKSDNSQVFLQGFVLGATGVFIIALIVLSYA